MLTKEFSKIRRFGIVMFLICLFAIGPPASASPPDEPELQEYFSLLEQELPLITTGISRPLEKSKVPASITVVTGEEIRLLGLRSLTDVINYIVPGGIGDIHRSSRTGLYSFRGITVDNNGKYVFMVDGLNCGDLTVWGAFNERYLGLLDELDRIEIIQGTGSILYGSGAISGIINFITKTGKDFQGTEVTAGYGSWDKVETSVKFGEKTSNEDHEFYYLGFKRSGGSRPHGETGTVSTEQAGPGRRWDHFDNSGKIHANIKRGDFTLRMRYVRDRFEEPYRKGSAPSVDTADNYWIEDYFFVQPEITRKLSDVSSIKANLSFVMNQVGFEKIHDWVASTDTSDPANTQMKYLSEGDELNSSGERKFRAQLFHYYDGWENHKLTTGAELFWMHAGPDFSGENRLIQRVKTVGTQRAKYKTKYMKAENLYFGAVFFEDMYKWSDKTTLFFGARLENHNKTRPNITPRVAISHDVSERTNWKLLYNRGFRTPDWKYYDVNKNFSKDRPRPERVDSFEGHITHKFSPKFSLTTVAYYTIYKDLIGYFRSYGGYANYSKARSAGLEVTGDYRTDNLKLQLSHSFSKPVHMGADNFSDVYLSYDRRNWAQFPTHMTKANAIIHLIPDKCILGLTYLRMWGIKGQRNAHSKLKRSGDYVNATVTLNLQKDLDLQLSIYNLTGEDHPWFGADTDDGASRAINPHTEYFIRLRYKF